MVCIVKKNRSLTQSIKTDYFYRFNAGQKTSIYLIQRFSHISTNTIRILLDLERNIALPDIAELPSRRFLNFRIYSNFPLIGSVNS